MQGARNTGGLGVRGSFIQRDTQQTGPSGESPFSMKIRTYRIPQYRVSGHRGASTQNDGFIVNPEKIWLRVGQRKSCWGRGSNEINGVEMTKR